MELSAYCERARTFQNASRAIDEHRICYGFLHPLLHKEREFCRCHCHDTWNPPDYQRAIDDAVKRTYGEQ